MYAKCSGIKLKSYHHVHLDNEFKNDCRVWCSFLENAEVDKQMLCRPFVDLNMFESSIMLQFFTDATKSPELGFGCYFDGEWTYGKWEHDYIKKYDPSIEYLELFDLCVGIFVWSDKIKNKRIVIFCDNQAVISMVNNMTSSCKNCMILIRLLVLDGLI